jgi:hypothetical protein
MHCFDGTPGHTVEHGHGRPFPADRGRPVFVRLVRWRAPSLPWIAGQAPCERCLATTPRRLGGRLLAKSLGQPADLGFWVTAVAAQGLQER